MMEGFVHLSGDSLYLVDLKEYFGANYSNDSFDYGYEEGDVCDLKNSTVFEAVFLPTLYSVAFIIGVVGNGLLLGVLFQSRKSWSVTDTFILHLAVSDILLLLTLPLWASQAASHDGWQFGTDLCKITGSVFTINFYSGIFLLACISVDRYLSIVHATQMYTRRKSWMVHMSCLLVWCFSVLLSIPDWIFLEETFDERRSRKECTRKYSKFSQNAEDETLKWQLDGCTMLSAFCFLQLSWFSATPASCCSCSVAPKASKKQRAFKVIIAVVAVFFFCWTPYNVALLADTFQKSNNSMTCDTNSSLDKALTVTSSLGYLHCSLNPILYAFVGVKFRRQLLNILRSMGCKLKTSMKLESFNRRSSIWSESRETSNSIAI